MIDDAVRELATRAGIAAEWRDYADKPKRVPLETLRRILPALGLPCETLEDVSHSRQLLDAPQMPALTTGNVGEPVVLPTRTAGESQLVKLVFEDGTATTLTASTIQQKCVLPSIQRAGYHSIELGSTRIALAIAPKRCVTVDEMAPGQRIAGLAAQTYALRSAGDCGIGDMAGVVALANAASELGIDALALSPLHALFAAAPGHFSPYSPSNRMFYNPLHADPAILFGSARFGRARTAAGVGVAERQVEASALINWPISSSAKLSVLRCLFEDFEATDLAADSRTDLAADLVRFRVERGTSLEQHATFEALHGARLQADSEMWSWRTWPAEWRDPHSVAVRNFSEKNQIEILFHIFLQWLAERSLAAAQRTVTRAGMRIGLISDLAVGMSGSGSHAWMNQGDILGGLEIGAPPDLFNTDGQNWGLTTFSPRALATGGYEPFTATIRACMRYAGGVRIDHAMGLMRLWVTPCGARPSEGAYLAYPLDDLLRLTALESCRHRAVVIGEDLGTVPEGFRDRLSESGIYGMSILWFEREERRFKPPRAWPTETVAMTSTHDLPPVAAWWRGSDLKLRKTLGVLRDVEIEETSRAKDREALWAAFRGSKLDTGKLPPADEAARIADDATSYIAHTPSPLAVLPLEDALALDEQPNLPGTIDEHPNWRRRYDADANSMLNAPAVRKRVRSLAMRGAQ
jgi:4-alpha-glucanotransferase